MKKGGLDAYVLHVHDTLWAKADPTRGPATEPNAHMEPRYPNHADMN